MIPLRRCVSPNSKLRLLRQPEFDVVCADVAPLFFPCPIFCISNNNSNNFQPIRRILSNFESVARGYVTG